MSFLATEIHWKLLRVSYTSMIYSLIDVLYYMYPCQHTYSNGYISVIEFFVHMEKKIVFLKWSPFSFWMLSSTTHLPMPVENTSSFVLHRHKSKVLLKNIISVANLSLRICANKGLDIGEDSVFHA